MTPRIQPPAKKIFRCQVEPGRLTISSKRRQGSRDRSEPSRVDLFATGLSDRVFTFSATKMAAMMTHVASAPVASRVAATNPKTTTARASSVSTASLRTNAAASRSAQFFQGERAAAFSLRQRQQSPAVSKRAFAKRVVSASASSGVPAVQAAAASEWKGAKLKPLGYSVLAGLLIWLIPAPAGVSAQAWHLLAVFVGTIVGIITNVRPRPVDPIPIGFRENVAAPSWEIFFPLHMSDG